MIKETNKIATVRETMTLLNVSRPTVLKWLDDGRFPSAAKGDGVTSGWNIPRKDIEAVRTELISDLQRQIERLRELGELQWQ